FLKNESRRRQQRRRPRSVSGLINPPNQTSQHTLRQKTDIFIKLLILLGNFVFLTGTGEKGGLHVATGPVPGNMQ
ncbi:hypothetical protein, partial [Agrobacterium leguminum]|uniref:hypothetical protein n=1 Tax=Agrobacterium leguminum TaxID=2792015 RepID=UPI0019D69185